MTKYFKPNNSTILYLNSSYNCIKSSSLSLAVSSQGAGYTSAPTINITSAAGDMGSGCSATAVLTSDKLTSISNVKNGQNYNTLPTITITGGGNPGVITNYSGLVGGSGYNSAPTVSASGGGGSGFAATAIIGAQAISTTFTITTAGTGYTTGQSLVFTGGGGSGAVATITATSGAITAISLTTVGSGYTSAPTITVSGAGTGAVITCALVNTITSINITNGGSNYTSTPTIVFTPTSGGTGASATPTITVGSSAVITPTFLKTYLYTWNIPEININDLAKISAINIIATNFAATTPYTYRLVGLQYDSRDSFFSDYGNPILSMAQNTNVCSYGSLGGESFAIILQSQPIRQIQISVDDDISKMNSGQAANINFVIALEIEEYDPNYTQVGDPFGEAASRIKPVF